MYRRALWESWIRDYLQRRYPELVAPLRAVLDAFETSVVSGVLTPEHLARISECVRSRTGPLGENIAELLGQLAVQFPEAEQLIRELARSPTQRVRVNALVALSSIPPAPLHDDLLCAALTDRSSRIRRLGAAKIMQLGLKHLLPNLDDILAREQDEATRTDLTLSRDLLRDGFAAQPYGNGQVWVTCRRPNGGLVSAFVSDAEIESRGLSAVARRLLEHSPFGPTTGPAGSES